MADRERERGSKHWCEHCRCWTQPDPLSIRAHEGGSRHKDALKNFLIEQRKRKVEERRAAEATSRTLAEISAAAGAAVSSDFASAPPPLPPPPLPPPPPPLGAAGLKLELILSSDSAYVSFPTHNPYNVSYSHSASRGNDMLGTLWVRVNGWYSAGQRRSPNKGVRRVRRSTAAYVCKEKTFFLPLCYRGRIPALAFHYSLCRPAIYRSRPARMTRARCV